MAHAEAETADHLKKRKQQRRNRIAIAREQHLKDWNLTTARKFDADSEGHWGHPTLTDARGGTEPPRRLAQQLGVNRKLESGNLH